MNYLPLIAAVAFGAWSVYRIWNQVQDMKLKKLEVKKAADEKQLADLKQQEQQIPTTVAEQQANATEEQKDEFWEEHLGKSTDRK